MKKEKDNLRDAISSKKIMSYKLVSKVPGGDNPAKAISSPEKPESEGKEEEKKEDHTSEGNGLE